MSRQKSKFRPIVPVRHAGFSLINDLIQNIQDLYDQTPTEMALLMLRQAQHLKEIWWTDEDDYRGQELDEQFKNFN
jgi:hypothetical protein